jgi:hypothetical protein
MLMIQRFDHFHWTESIAKEQALKMSNFIHIDKTLFTGDTIMLHP